MHNLFVFFSLILVNITFFLIKLSSARNSIVNVTIVVSEGRSGSTELMDIINNIYDEKGYSAGELFNVNSGNYKTRVPWEPIKNEIEKAQKEKKQILYFKWKPHEFLNQIIKKDEGYLEIFQLIKQKGFKIVYNYRNFLDVYISHVKVDDLKDSHEANAYNCHDTKCADERASITTSITSTKDMISDITAQEEQHLKLIALFEKYQISYIDVKYELLNKGSDKDRLKYLQRLVNYLKPGMKASLDLFDTKVLMSTSYHQADIVDNYEVVKEALKNTKYAYLLHP